MNISKRKTKVNVKVIAADRRTIEHTKSKTYQAADETVNNIMIVQILCRKYPCIIWPEEALQESLCIVMAVV